ncbi:MAG: HAMP domain-containing histidine kinase [Phycisphaeraceae bacterium]|nr:HAMP domain-containing histidine kinase [Phycisphaeraceae bacterium]
MRSRRRLTWVIFAVCILAVLEGLGWVTWRALSLERREREARAAASFEQSIRLALWRMESEITPIIAAESARPYFHYIPFYPAERAYTKMFQQVRPNEVLVPSPLLEGSGRFIRLHFQLDENGGLSSPQAPTGNQRDLAEAQYLDSEYIVLAGQLLGDVERILRPDQGIAKDVSGSTPQAQAGQVWQVEDSEFRARERAAQTAQTMNLNEQQRRNRPAGRADDQVAESSPAPSVAAPPLSPPLSPPMPPPTAAAPARSQTESAVTKKENFAADQSPPPSWLKQYQEAGFQDSTNRVEQGPFEANWYANPATGEEELLLVRSVTIDGRTVRQGLWIDWPDLRSQLIDACDDLLPGAALAPTSGPVNEAGELRLASIPVRLLPGPMPAPAMAGITPTQVTLALTWAAVLGAIIAIGIVLRKAMELSERRGRFVSAVTHELRTPLTTFCLYTEMLADGMVADDASRRHYLSTLKSESGRLARIVQNVLDYAGIGGQANRHLPAMTAISLGQLIERCRPALEQCAAKAGMQLEVDVTGGTDANIRVDPQTIERILLNLVENAGKYASEAVDRRIHVVAGVEKSKGKHSASIRVIDHGPGVPKSERRKIFRAFHRAEREVQGAKSGLGLGLALAQELARDMKGRLLLNPARTDGAEFILHLPVDT